MPEGIYKSFPMVSQISSREQFLWLMSQENEIAKFITQSMKLRSEELKKIISPENVRPIRTAKKEEKTTTTTKSKKVSRNCKPGIVMYC